MKAAAVKKRPAAKSAAEVPVKKKPAASKAGAVKKPAAAPPPPQEEGVEEDHEEAGPEEEEEEEEGGNEDAEEEEEHEEDEAVDPDCIDGPGEVHSCSGGQVRTNRRRCEFYTIVQWRPGSAGSWKQILQFSDKQFENCEVETTLTPRQLRDRACKESFCFDFVG